MRREAELRRANRGDPRAAGLPPGLPADRRSRVGRGGGLRGAHALRLGAAPRPLLRRRLVGRPGAGSGARHPRGRGGGRQAPAAGPLARSQRLARDCSPIPSACAPCCRAAERPIVIEITEHDVIDDYDAGARGGQGSRARRPPGGRRRGRRRGQLRPHHRPATRLREARHRPRAARQRRPRDARPWWWACAISPAPPAAGSSPRESRPTRRPARSPRLGVEFGQGYLFGHPEPVERWAPDDPGQRRPGARP